MENFQSAYKLIFGLIIIFLIGNCKNQLSSKEILSIAKIKIETSNTFIYDYQAEFDTPMNNTKYKSSANVTFTKIQDSFHGFGFYGKDKFGEYIFNGKDYQEIDQEEKLIISHPKEEIKKDSTYFHFRAFLTDTPFDLLSENDFEKTIDTIINQKEYFVFEQIETPKSVVHESRKIKKHVRYFIEKENAVYDRLEVITIINGDTAQKANIYFEEIKFEKKVFDFTKIDRSKFRKYKEINSLDLENDNCQNIVSVGSKIRQKNYFDVSENNISLFDNHEKSSVIMFSFIGCGGCEYALGEMKKKDFNFKEDINFYYSSPSDKKKSIQEYLNKRKYQFKGFSKESQMNEEFSVCFYPTFVALNKKGIVTKVISGYDDEVEKMIFDN